jgi:hypothetical protein
MESEEHGGAPGSLKNSVAPSGPADAIPQGRTRQESEKFTRLHAREIAHDPTLTRSTDIRLGNIHSPYAHPMSKPITVRLIGGLGNQLFGYDAGAALAAKHGTTVRLDTSWTRHGITDHGIEILRFDLPGEWISNDSFTARLSAPGTIPGRAWAKAVREIPALRGPLRIHEAPGAGHDPTLFD